MPGVSPVRADKLKRTFKGVFAVLDIVKTITGGGLKIAFKALSAILGAFDMNVLDLTAGIGGFVGGSLFAGLDKWEKI